MYIFVTYLVQEPTANQRSSRTVQSQSALLSSSPPTAVDGVSEWGRLLTREGDIRSSFYQTILIGGFRVG